MKIHTPTFILLTSSIVISFSGAFRMLIAYFITGNEIKIFNIVAGFLIIYATYTFDRIVGGGEDKVNRSELTGARKDIVLAISIFSVLLAALILFFDNLILWAFFPFAVGYIYNKKIKIGNVHFKLKGGLGMKNLNVALIWGATTTGIVLKGYGNMMTNMSIFLFFFSKSFINTVLNDFRDIAGDKTVGLKTLPIHLGEKNTKHLLIGIHLFSHGWITLAMIWGLIRFELFILLICFLVGMIYIPLYTRSPARGISRYEDIVRQVAYKWEFFIAAGLRTIWKIICESVYFSGIFQEIFKQFFTPCY